MPEMDQNLSNIWGNQHLVTSYFYKKTRVSAVQTHTSSRIPMIFNDSWYPWVNAGESPLWYKSSKTETTTRDHPRIARLLLRGCPARPFFAGPTAQASCPQ